MLSFSDYKTKKRLAEMVFRYDLDLTGIAEAVAYSKNHQLTEEVLNEFLGRAAKAIGSAIKGAFTGGRDSWQESGSGRKLAEKSVQDFYNSIIKMGISEPEAKNVMQKLQQYLDTNEKKIAARQQAAPAQRQQAAPAPRQPSYGGLDDQGPKMNLTPASGPAPAGPQVTVPTPRLPAGDEFTTRRP